MFDFYRKRGDDVIAGNLLFLGAIIALGILAGAFYPGSIIAVSLIGLFIFSIAGMIVNTVIYALSLWNKSAEKMIVIDSEDVGKGVVYTISIERPVSKNKTICIWKSNNAYDTLYKYPSGVEVSDAYDIRKIIDEYNESLRAKPWE